MSNKLIFCASLLLSTVSLADTTTTVISSEHESVVEEKLCGPSKKEAEETCKSWLAEQKKAPEAKIKYNACTFVTQHTDPKVIGDCHFEYKGKIVYKMKTDIQQTDKTSR